MWQVDLLKCRKAYDEFRDDEEGSNDETANEGKKDAAGKTDAVPKADGVCGWHWCSQGR